MCYSSYFLNQKKQNRMKTIAPGSPEAKRLEPKRDTTVTIEGTGKSKHLPKGVVFEETEINAKLLVESGAAKYSNKELEDTTVELLHDFHGDKKGDLIDVDGKRADDMIQAGLAKEKKSKAKTEDDEKEKEEKESATEKNSKAGPNAKK